MLLKHDAEHAKELAVRELEHYEEKYQDERKVREQEKEL
jgi:hypothetical protein